MCSCCQRMWQAKQKAPLAMPLSWSTPECQMLSVERSAKLTLSLRNGSGDLRIPYPASIPGCSAVTKLGYFACLPRYQATACIMFGGVAVCCSNDTLSLQ